jgi:hypothetical protein
MAASAAGEITTVLFVGGAIATGGLILIGVGVIGLAVFAFAKWG